MRLLYIMPELKDLSQGSRIAFVRQFRNLSQDKVSEYLGLTGECKRRTMTRYEKGGRNPKEERTRLIAKYLNVSYESIKQYDFKNPIDLIYMFMWLEELIPNYSLDLTKVPNLNDNNIVELKKSLIEWGIQRKKRKSNEITYEQYLNWKLNYKVKGDNSNEKKYNKD